MVSTTPHAIMLDTWEIIQVTGKDALSFLQGQVTVKLEDITDTQFKITGYCNLKGRLHGIFYIAKYHDAYWLIMPTSISNHIVTTLKKYAMFSKVDIQSLQASHQIWGVQETTHQQAWHCQLEDNYLVLDIPHQRRLIIAEQKHVPQQITQCPQLTQAQWQALDVEAGLPFIYEPTIETLLPHHVNGKALGMLNFEKGCYLGQEIIARMEYKGQIKKQLYQGICTSLEVLPPGIKVISESEQIVGVLLYSAQQDGEQHLLICMDKTLTQQDIALNLSSKPAIQKLTAIE